MKKILMITNDEIPDFKGVKSIEINFGNEPTYKDLKFFWNAAFLKFFAKEWHEELEKQKNGNWFKKPTTGIIKPYNRTY